MLQAVALPPGLNIESLAAQHLFDENPVMLLKIKLDDSNQLGRARKRQDERNGIIVADELTPLAFHVSRADVLVNSNIFL